LKAQLISAQWQRLGLISDKISVSALKGQVKLSKDNAHPIQRHIPGEIK